LRVLNALCYSTPAVNLSGRILGNNIASQSYLAEVLVEYGEALAYQGKYRVAGKMCLKAFNVARKSNMDQRALFMQIDLASDNFRRNGDYLFAFVLSLYKRTRSFTYLGLQNEIVFLRDFFDIAKRMHLSKLMQIIKKKVILRLQRIYKDWQKEENYATNPQRLNLWANRFDITPEEVNNALNITTPLPELGYTELNLPLAEIMDFIYRTNYQKLPTDKANLDKIREYLYLARELGISPEIWKLQQLLKKTYPLDFSASDLKEMDAEFNKCEYTWPERVLKKWVGY